MKLGLLPFKLNIQIERKAKYLLSNGLRFKLFTKFESKNQQQKHV